MAHSKIFQVSEAPIDNDDYKCSLDYYDNHQEFADWIGDEVKDEEERKKYIEWLVKELDGTFSMGENDTLVFNGKKPLNKFLEAWANKLQELAKSITKDTITSSPALSDLRNVVSGTHKNSDYRFDIESWTGYAAPLCEFIDFIANRLKKGDKVYIGAIIDFHY